MLGRRLPRVRQELDAVLVEGHSVSECPDDRVAVGEG